MLITNYPTTTTNMVNYSILPTQASNEVYIPETETPDSTAFLMRNSVFIEISQPAIKEDTDSAKKDESDSTSVFYF